MIFVFRHPTTSKPLLKIGTFDRPINLGWALTYLLPNFIICQFLCKLKKSKYAQCSDNPCMTKIQRQVISYKSKAYGLLICKRYRSIAIKIIIFVYAYITKKTFFCEQPLNANYQSIKFFSDFLE